MVVLLSVCLYIYTVCFGIYDLNDDGYISREEMFQMLKNTMAKQPSEEDPDEGIKDLVETMIKRMVWTSLDMLVQSFPCCFRILTMTLRFLWRTTWAASDRRHCSLKGLALVCPQLKTLINSVPLCLTKLTNLSSLIIA